jgi:tellurium resistance protein TerD
MPLTLPLVKPGEDRPKLNLNLNKGSLFHVELFWESHHDLDAHALLANNDGNGAKVSAYEQVLSTYATKKMNPKSGVLEANPDGSFSTPEGALTHSGDSRTGIGKVLDEIITIDGAKVPAGVNEVPFFVTIHTTDGSGARLKFGDIKDAGIRIKDGSGKELASFHLGQEFGNFNAIQMGSLMLGPTGWEFAAAGSGFMGDFNTVLGHFS